MKNGHLKECYNSQTLTTRAFLLRIIDRGWGLRYNIAAEIQTNRRKFGVKMNTNPFEDTTFWRDGTEMPQEAVNGIYSDITKTFLLYSFVVLLPIILVIIGGCIIVVKEKTWAGLLALPLLIPAILFIRSYHKRLRILKKRDFLFIEGVTGGLYMPRPKSLPSVFVKTDSSEIMTNSYLMRTSIGLKNEGVPVYSVMFNIYGRGFLKGGFFRDPIVFKKKN